MIDQASRPGGSFDGAIREFIFGQAAATGVVPQVEGIARELSLPEGDIRDAVQRLAAAKVLILAPNGGDIWAANPFCAVPSGFRVEVETKQYWGICAWDALGIVAAVDAPNATITAPCGDCGDLLQLEFADRKLVRAEGVIHFAVPARNWWKNIGFA